MFSTVANSVSVFHPPTNSFVQEFLQLFDLHAGTMSQTNPVKRAKKKLDKQTSTNSVRYERTGDTKLGVIATRIASGKQRWAAIKTRSNPREVAGGMNRRP